MTHSDPIPAPQTERPEAWLDFDEILRWVVSVFGTAAYIATLRVLDRRLHKLLARWIVTLEALARRLLLRMAADLDVFPKPVKNRIERKMPANAGRPGFSDENSAAWGVSFKLIVERRRPGPRKAAARRRALPKLLLPACPLAERLEALSRVAAAPHRYALRLARRLKQRPATLAAILANRPPAGDHLGELLQRADAALAARFGAAVLDSS